MSASETASVDVRGRLASLSAELRLMEGLNALWLFGSHALGKATPLSDVDIAYLLDDNVAGEKREGLETKLYTTISFALKTDKFSFVDISTAPSWLAWSIISEGQLLICRNLKAVAEIKERIYRFAPDIRLCRRTGNIWFLEALSMDQIGVDKDRIVDFLRGIHEDIRDLRRKRDISKSGYLNSRDTQAVVERRLQTAIESCINIGNHIISRLGLRSPQDYADVFRRLGEEGILSSDITDRMMDMAKLRNLLVHLYWRIEHERIYNSLPRRIAALEEFCRQIAEWLKGLDGQS